MKAMTIILVVFAHTTRMFTQNGVIDILMKSNLLTLVTEFVYMFHMPAFVAITGAVYFFVKRTKGGYTNQKNFAVNKAFRLLIPYIFFAIVVVLPTLLYTGVTDNILYFLFNNILLFSGPNHLWYSIMIFNVFWIFNLFENKVYSSNFLVTITIFLVLHGVGSRLPGNFQLNGTFSYLIYFYCKRQIIR